MIFFTSAVFNLPLRAGQLRVKSLFIGFRKS